MAEKRLTDRTVAGAKPRETVYYLADGAGLRLRVRPDGSRTWVFRYTLAGKESTAGLGTYPDVTLETAREAAQEARRLVAAGIAPPRHRRERRAAAIAAGEATFQAIAEEWLIRNRADWSEHHHERNAGLLRRILFPALGARPISEITEAELLAPLRRAHDGGIRESARRARAVAAQVFDFAKDTHRATHNPARELVRSSVLKRQKNEKVKHFAALPQDQVGAFLRAIDSSGIELTTRVALLMAMVTGLRDSSLRAVRWSEVDLKNAVLHVPGTRMKSGRDYRTPLPRQLVRELRALAKITRPRRGDGPIFKSYGKHGVIAENSLRLAMHKMGFPFTLHGFRSLLTDVLNERDFNRDAIEAQLDHVEKDATRRAYLRSDFFDTRGQMLQWLADWCDAQREQKKDPPMPATVKERQTGNVVAMPKKKRAA